MKYSIILPYFERPEHLLLTLKSYEYFYKGKDLEVIIVDDCSSLAKVPTVPTNFSLPIKVIRLKKKNGINPCIPYNVGARHASGKVLILSSPEIVHLESILSKKFAINRISNSSYFVFSVYALANKQIVADLIESESHQNFIEKVNDLTEKFIQFPDFFGGWYTHKKWKPVGLNFLSAITSESYYQNSGFDERFRIGTGYDDYEFRDRLIRKKFDFRHFGGMNALHLDHEVVSEKFNLETNTNKKLFYKSKILRYRNNDKWGAESCDLIYCENYS